MFFSYSGEYEVEVLLLDECRNVLGVLLFPVFTRAEIDSVCHPSNLQSRLSPDVAA